MTPKERTILILKAECKACFHSWTERCDPTMNYPGVFYLEFRERCSIKKDMDQEECKFWKYRGQDDNKNRI